MPPCHPTTLPTASNSRSDPPPYRPPVTLPSLPSQYSQMGFSKLGRFTKWGPSVIGIGLIPFMPLIDHPVSYAALRAAVAPSGSLATADTLGGHSEPLRATPSHRLSNRGSLFRCGDLPCFADGSLCVQVEHAIEVAFDQAWPATTHDDSASTDKAHAD